MMQRLTARKASTLDLKSLFNSADFRARLVPVLDLEELDVIAVWLALHDEQENAAKLDREWTEYPAMPPEWNDPDAKVQRVIDFWQDKDLALRFRSPVN